MGSVNERLVMGVFSRFKDIVNANLNSMLDKAEDPEKMIKLMIQEMEDTLVEIKASCAGAMASRAKANRALESARTKLESWGRKAELAIEKGREDLAREALVEKRNTQSEVDNLESELSQFADLADKYQQDIVQLEEKLDAARNKHRILLQRQIQASKSQRASAAIKKADTSDAFVKFEQYENRIDRMEADAEMGRVRNSQPTDLDSQFRALELDSEIESELQALKAKKQSQSQG